MADTDNININIHNDGNDSDGNGGKQPEGQVAGTAGVSSFNLWVGQNKISAMDFIRRQ